MLGGCEAFRLSASGFRVGNWTGFDFAEFYTENILEHRAKQGRRFSVLGLILLID